MLPLGEHIRTPPYLSRKHNCHINMEICTLSGPEAVRYICKYTLKGGDFGRVGLAHVSA